MDLTIVGASAATQNPGGACSSYLLRQGGTSVVLDMGSGAFGRLQQHVEPDAVDAIVISHLHADHTLDLIPYRYWLDFRGADARPRRPRRPRLLLPPEGHGKLLRISGLQDPSPTFFSDVFDVAEYDPTWPVQLGELTVGFHATKHIPHTYALRVTNPGGDTLAYSADSGPCPRLLDVARDADLFLCENANAEDSTYDLHLKPSQAAAYAREAGARRLVLTHRWYLSGLDAAARGAAGIFDGPVSIAREGATYTIGV